jgi:hypothetical protein
LIVSWSEQRLPIDDRSRDWNMITGKPDTTTARLKVELRLKKAAKQ